MKATYKVGIVGYGYMGEIRRRVAEQHPRLTPVAICDTNEAVSEKAGAYRFCRDYREMLKTDIDIVFVCTPNKFSPQVTIDSLRAGKHVFCEKPPGRTLDDIRAIMDAERTARGKLMFGFNHRFHPGVMKAKIVAETGRIGKILCIRGVYGKSGGMNFSRSWRNNAEMSGGGILLDQGIHMLDLFLYFCGGFDKVKSIMSDMFWKFGVEENAYVTMKNKIGQIAFLHSSSTLWKHTFRMDIILEHGYMVVDGLLSKTGSYGRERLIIGKRQFEDEAEAVGNPSEEVTYFDRDQSWELEVTEFIRCIDEGLPVTVSSSMDALKAMEIVDMAYRDAEGQL